MCAGARWRATEFCLGEKPLCAMLDKGMNGINI